MLAVVDAAVVVAVVVALGLPAAMAAVAAPVLVLVNAVGGLYAPRLSLSALDDVPALLGRVPTTLAVSVAVAAATGAAPSTRGTVPVAVVLVVAAGLLFLALVVVRASVYAAVRVRRMRRQHRERTLLIGSGPLTDRLAATLRDHPEYGLEPLGVLDAEVDRAGVVPGPTVGDALARLGRPADLASVVRTHQVACVVIAYGTFRDAEVVAALRAAERLDCDIYVVPRFFELALTHGRRVEDLFGVPCVRVRTRPWASPGAVGKRLLDVVAAAAALVLLLPVLVACAVAVRWETGPQVLFRQLRVGRDGRPFTLLKFRTLKPANEAEAATRWTIASDDRLGPVGRFLRRTSIDELPQLWNVLIGDMSLVGPRPERPYFVDRFSAEFDGYATRHRMPVGITGLAQVNGLRGDTSIAERVRFDNSYIDQWSLWTDLKILLRTVASLIRPGGG